MSDDLEHIDEEPSAGDDQGHDQGLAEAMAKEEGKSGEDKTETPGDADPAEDAPDQATPEDDQPGGDGAAGPQGTEALDHDDSRETTDASAAADHDDAVRQAMETQLSTDALSDVQELGQSLSEQGVSGGEDVSEGERGNLTPADTPQGDTPDPPEATTYEVTHDELGQSPYDESQWEYKIGHSKYADYQELTQIEEGHRKSEIGQQTATSEGLADSINTMVTAYAERQDIGQDPMETYLLEKHGPHPYTDAYPSPEHMSALEDDTPDDNNPDDPEDEEDEKK